MRTKLSPAPAIRAKSNSVCSPSMKIITSADNGASYDKGLIVGFQLTETSACGIRGHCFAESPFVNRRISVRQVLFKKVRRTKKCHCVSLVKM